MEGYNYKPNVEYFLHPKIDIGNMDNVCIHCQALKFKNEPPGMCCSNGKDCLQILKNPPEPLLSLTSGNNADSIHFLSNIRKYNSCFQMTSFGSTKINEGGFMPRFKIQGQVYHTVGWVIQMGDTDQETNQRCSKFSGVNRNIVSQLQQLFHEKNSLVRIFETAVEKCLLTSLKLY